MKKLLKTTKPLYPLGYVIFLIMELLSLSLLNLVKQENIRNITELMLILICFIFILQTSMFLREENSAKKIISISLLPVSRCQKFLLSLLKYNIVPYALIWANFLLMALIRQNIGCYLPTLAVITMWLAFTNIFNSWRVGDNRIVIGVASVTFLLVAKYYESYLAKWYLHEQNSIWIWTVAIILYILSILFSKQKYGRNGYAI